MKIATVVPSTINVIPTADATGEPWKRELPRMIAMLTRTSSAAQVIARKNYHSPYLYKAKSTLLRCREYENPMSTARTMLPALNRTHWYRCPRPGCDFRMGIVHFREAVRTG